MGSALGPALANIFVGFYKQKLFDQIDEPAVYFRYVDDTFVIFESERDCNLVQEKTQHPTLKFTIKNEQGNFLGFLDVFVKKEGSEFLTSVYGKPTFTGHYIRWNSLAPKKAKSVSSKRP